MGNGLHGDFDRGYFRSKEFLAHMGNGLHGDFDRGYFSAWADCMRIISRMNIPAPKAAEEKSKIETVRSDKSQATIANFIQETGESQEVADEKADEKTD
jgi:hypothetical protein